MLRNKPTSNYCGLTFILSIPSRHDKLELFTGSAGEFIEAECLVSHGILLENCDIRLIDDKSILLDGTKVIVLMGSKAFSQYTCSVLSLDEGRGAPYERKGIQCIPTFAAQDAVDPKDYESELNALATDEDNESEDDGLGEIFASKGRGRTARSNYRFWVKSDIEKAIRILKNDGNIPKLYEHNPTYIIDPPLDLTLRKLEKSRGLEICFDMETDFSSMDMRCFSFSCSDDPYTVLSVPTLTTDYKQYYGKSQVKLYRALFRAIYNNTVIAHNGSQFDFLVLAYKYHIVIRSVYDTLVAQHRIYPTVEKSLGHCVSLATYEQFHKNEGAHGFFNHQQVEQLLKYCGKDVFTMWLVREWQRKQTENDPGLAASIKLANTAIRPYLITTLLGVNYDEVKIKKAIATNDRKMAACARIIESLTGKEVEPLISNKKCTKYFHLQMGLPVVARAKSGGPSLAEDALYKLALKNKNPVIDFLIQYRQIQKESGTLSFNPWINRNEIKLNI